MGRCSLQPSSPRWRPNQVHQRGTPLLLPHLSLPQSHHPQPGQSWRMAHLMHGQGGGGVKLCILGLQPPRSRRRQRCGIRVGTISMLPCRMLLTRLMGCSARRTGKGRCRCSVTNTPGCHAVKSKTLCGVLYTSLGLPRHSEGMGVHENRVLQ